MGVISGIGFGLYFIFISQVPSGYVFFPLSVMRLAEFLVAVIMLLWRRQSVPGPLHSPLSLLVGVLDAGGNSFYLLAKGFTRLDVAVVLASLYPAVTVLLAYFILKQKAGRGQWAGVALCLAAIALITV